MQILTRLYAWINNLDWDILLSSLILIFITSIAIFAPLISPNDPHDFIGKPLEPPSSAHLLGTNDAGQDILSELIYGTRISLSVAIGAALGTMLLSLIIGGLSGYFGGWLDRILMRFTDVMLTLPRLPLLILLASFLDAGLWQTILIIALLFWQGKARLIRAQVQSLRQRGYIKMARSYGASSLYIFQRHILPQIAPLIVFGLVAAAGQAVAMEAGLAFLGLGDATAKSWGLMMRFALNLPGLLLTERWLWWLLPPALSVTVLMLAITFLGIGLERIWNPRLEQHD